MTSDAPAGDSLLAARNHGVTVVLRPIVERMQGILSERILLVDQTELDAIMLRFPLVRGGYAVCPTQRLAFEENKAGNTVLTPCPSRHRRGGPAWVMRVRTDGPVRSAWFHLTRELHERFEPRPLAIYRPAP